MRNNQRRFEAPDPPPQSAAPTMVYAVPTDFVELPSRGMFYPDGHPLCGQKTIEIKYMTAKEEDILSSTALIKNGIVIERFLKSVIVDQTIDPETLLIGDRNAIMVAARITAYGPRYDLTITCGECSKTSNYAFDLTMAKFIDECFNEEYLKTINCSFNKEKSSYEVELPNSKVLVELKLLTGKEMVEIPNFENSLVTSMLSQFIVSVNNDYTPAVIQNFIQDMPAGDSKFLRDNYIKIVPNIDLTQEFFCKHCGFSADQEVPLTAEFFWPR